MDVREKLVELLKSILPNFRNNMAYWGEKPIFEFADCLLANGVTVQEWISVNDRLPEKDGAYLTVINLFGYHSSINVHYFAKDGEAVDEYNLAGEKDVWYFYDSEYGYVSTDSVTHWMPLPELPKGE